MSYKFARHLIVWSTALCLLGLSGCTKPENEKSPEKPSAEAAATPSATPSVEEAAESTEDRPVLDLRSSGQATVAGNQTTETAGSPTPAATSLETPEPLATPQPTAAATEPVLPPDTTDTTQSAYADAVPQPSVGPEATASQEATDSTATATTAAAAPGPIAPEPDPPALDQSSSPYLRQAAKAAVKWQPWSAGTFEQAKQENKPILIDVGANWSHACRVMNAVTYEDAEVAKLVNDNFVAVKVDCDERPDIDQRYQTAHMLIYNSRPTGYPLTAFALPDGRSFESQQFLPPDSKGEQMGMKDVLKQVIQIVKERRADAEKQADVLERSLIRTNSLAATGQKAGPDTLKAIQSAVTAEFDKETAGFGNPKAARFTHGNAILFLLQQFSDTSDKAALDMATKPLAGYSRSGLRDHVLGGYFHYSDDSALSKPHFEKLLYVQAELLSANALAYAATRRSGHKEAVGEIRKVCRDTFENPAGGFYSSQDADMSPEDNGSYYTWTQQEVEKIAGNGNDTKVFMRYLNMDGAGRERKVLFADDRLQEAGNAFKMSYDDAQKALNAVRKKLHAARMDQQAPWVNKAMVVSWNALMIGAYLDAYKYTGDSDAQAFALKSMDALLESALDEQQGAARVVYKGQASTFGMLEDNAHLAVALLQCFEVSGKKDYLDTAESLMQFIEERFLDQASGLYTDRIANPGAPGLLKTAAIPVVDNRIMSGNAAAATAWYHLSLLTGKKEYMERARRLVNGAAGNKAIETLSGAGFGRAAAMVLNGAPKALIIGNEDDAARKAMRDAALPVFRMGKIVEVLSPDEAAKTDYPASKDGKPIAYVCTSVNCAPPVRETEKLVELVKTFGKSDAAKAAAGEAAGAEAAADSQSE